MQFRLLVKIWCTWAPVIQIFLKLKSYFCVTKIYKKKYLHVGNYLSHKRAKTHVQILCILGYTKMKNV
jgi:hypothetical protein